MKYPPQPTLWPAPALFASLGALHALVTFGTHASLRAKSMLDTFSIRAKTLVILAALSILAGGIRWHAAQLDRRIPDEGIAQAVVTQVLDSGSLDTNWNRTYVENRFRYNEYNFSSYYLAAAAYERLTGMARADTHDGEASLLVHLRGLSVILGALCVLVAGLLGLRLSGAPAAITAALLTACSPGLFQDSLYARPETFVTLLSLLWMLALTARGRYGSWALASAGLLVGILIATKITFLLYLPFPLLLASRMLDRGDDALSDNDARHTRWSWAIGAYFNLVAIGFALGAPYAVKLPVEYLQGVEALLNQYEGSLLSTGTQGFDGLLGRVTSNCAYLAYTIGYPALLLSACGVASLVSGKKAWQTLIFIAPLALLLYFMRIVPLFERNFSQSLPVLFVLAGMGVGAVLARIHPMSRLQPAVAPLLIVAATLTPASVTAKILHPALDGSFQAEIDTETHAIAGDNQTAVFDTEYYAGLFCGHYVYMLKQPGHRAIIGSMLRQGFRIVAQVQSPFDDASYTLQTYYAPTMIYLAPPSVAPESCGFSLEPLQVRPGLTPVRAHVAATGGWIPDGSKSGVLPVVWPWPLFDSHTGAGADHDTGTLSIGPFHACGGFTVPYSIGPGHVNVSLKLTRRSGKNTKAIYAGLLPGGWYQWYAMHIDAPAVVCADYSVEAEDHGTAWGQWLGIGLPVHDAATPEH